MLQRVAQSPGEAKTLLNEPVRREIRSKWSPRSIKKPSGGGSSGFPGMAKGSKYEERVSTRLYRKKVSVSVQPSITIQIILLKRATMEN